jgi:O-antigen ligase
VPGLPLTAAARATSRAVALGPQHAQAACVAATVVALAWSNGFYGASARTGLGVVLWWLIVLLVAAGLVHVAGRSRLASTAVLCFFLFAVWTGLSGLWSASIEDAHTEFTRTILYLGVLLLGLFLSGRASLRPWLVGLATGLVTVALIAFASRVEPSAFPDRGLAIRLPDSVGRLSFPVGYWNGLAILVALAVPLLLALAVEEGRSLPRAAALSALPLVVVDVYLASSRGGVIVMVVCTAAFVALAEDWWQALVLLAVPTVGSVAAVVLIAQERAFVNGPFGTHDAAAQGNRAAIALGAVCSLTGLVSLPLLRRRLPRPSLGFMRLAAAVGLVAVAAGVAAVHPLRLVRTFQQPPSSVSYDTGNFSAAHLASGAGNGRWQFWTAAVDQWHAHPIHGGGAGSFPDWWSAHGSISYAIKDAHSLYLQVLGELGIVGCFLLVAAVALGLVSAVRLTRGLRGAQRTAAAALAAVALGWAVGAGIDWMWQLTVVTSIGLFALGVAMGGPALGKRSPASPPAFRLGVAVLAILALALQGEALFVATRLADSHAAAARGDVSGAVSAAESARRIEPWASSPYLQLALLREQTGDLRRAELSLARAIERNPTDWTLRLVDVRLRVRLGDIAGARKALEEARRLNPRSPVLARSGG